MMEHEIVTDDYELIVYYTIEDNSFSHAFGTEHRKNELEIHGDLVKRNDTDYDDDYLVNCLLDWKKIQSKIMENYFNLE